MKIFSKKYKSIFFILFYLSSLIYPLKIVNCQNSHINSNFIHYRSDFFSLLFNNETYFGNEDYILNLTINIFYKNEINNFSFKLELVDREKNQISYSVEKRYNYHVNERAIYENRTKIGIIPIFTEDNLSNYQEVILAEFNSKILKGIMKEEDKDIIISNKGIPYYTIEVSMENYTVYYYSDYQNLLIIWEIGTSHEITLEKIFNITTFYGDIQLVDTNFDIHWVEYTPPVKILEIITYIIIICILTISFLTIFLLIRKKLKRNSIKSRKKKRKVEKYRKW